MEYFYLCRSAVILSANLDERLSSYLKWEECKKALDKKIILISIVITNVRFPIQMAADICCIAVIAKSVIFGVDEITLGIWMIP